jgi:hypothetical protein
MLQGSPCVGAAHGSMRQGYLFFSLPLGRTEVVGGVGRVEPDAASFGALVSFFGFFVILLLRCSPFGMNGSFQVFEWRLFSWHAPTTGARQRKGF